MASLSIILEDREDGGVQVKFRSTQALPESPSAATPAELVMLEISNMVAGTYNINEDMVITFGLIKPEIPKLIVH